MLSFVKSVVLGYVRVDFENVISRRRSGLIDFLYSRRVDQIPYEDVCKEVQMKVFQKRTQIYENLLAHHNELLTQQTNLLKHHKDLCRERISKEAKEELENMSRN